MDSEWLYKDYLEIHLLNCTNILVLLSSVSAVYVLWKWSSNRKLRLPPGPWGLPFLGYYPLLKRNDVHMQLSEMRKMYGPLVSLYLGSRLVVVLLDFPTLKEAFSKDSFLGRPRVTAFSMDKNSVSFKDMSGHLWKTNRSFTMHVMRDLGFGKSHMEVHIQNEILELLNRLAESKGKVLESRTLLLSSVSNTITALIFGRRLDHEDPQRHFLDSVVLEILNFFKQGNHAYFPWLNKILVFLRIWNYDKVKETLRRFYSLIDDEIDDHRKSRVSGHNRDYIDGYIQEIDEKGNAEEEGFSTRFLKGNIRSLFGAGSDTVRNTLEWILVTMAAFPEYQKRIQKEIDEQIGGQRIPNMNDLQRTPFTHATILEILRWVGSVPFEFVRLVTRDEKLMGYDIPKGTVAMGHLWGILHDPDLWVHPMTFKPERFISKDGNQIHKPEYFIPFSYGRRSCPGESLSYIELYLYLSSILQKFSVSSPEAKRKQDLFKHEVTISSQLTDTRLRFIQRKTV